jgi:phosphohistidine phosphatase
MRVYIVRHGKAHEQPGNLPEPSGTDELIGQPDFHRELTARGESQATFLADRLRALELRPEEMLVSRYPRAIQTARVIQRALDVDLRTEPGLEVDHPVGEAIELIEREGRDGVKSLMLVGHNPQLGELLGVLAHGLPPQELILKTGDLIALDFRAGQMIGGAKIVGRLRLSADKNDETIVGGMFALGVGQSGKMHLTPS